MAAEQIGRCKCPLCGCAARLSLAKSQLSVITCNGCNFQGFARSDRSDEKLRGLLIAEPAPAVAPPTAAPTPTPLPAAPPAPSRPSWGIF